MIGIDRVTNFQRYREIIAAFTRNGLGFLFIKNTVFTIRGHHARILDETHAARGISIGERIRKTCEELGPTFIKFGQILSTRTDIITQNVANQLAHLQDNVAPFPFECAKEVIEGEFKDKLENLFKSFSETPIASASMSQVYQAVLHNGSCVAVKVQRPDIRQIVDIDITILKRIAKFVDKYTKYGNLYDFYGMVEEFARVLANELDFTIEAENTDRFREARAHDSSVTAPEIKWVYTTSKVLTMEYIDGVKITGIRTLKQMGVDCDRLAHTFVDSLIMQMLSDGFFHADPHPGNIIVRENGQIVFIDLGMMGELSEKYKKLLTDMLIGLSLHNTRRVAQAIMDLGITHEAVQFRSFESSVADLLDSIAYRPLGKVNILQVFIGLFDLASTYKIKIPRAFTLIAKCLGTAQTIIEQLAPQLNMLEIAQETAKKVLLKSFDAGDMKNAMLSGFVDAVDTVKLIPGVLARFIKKAEETDFTFELKIKEMDKLEKNLTTLFNRISLSIILLAISIVLAGTIVAIGLFVRGSGSSEFLYDVSLFAVIAGLVVASVIVVGIVLSIFLSNRHK